MIEVKFTKELGTFSEGDVRSYDETSAARLVEGGYAELVAGEPAPVEKKAAPKRSAVAETVTVAEPS